MQKMYIIKTRIGCVYKIHHIDENTQKNADNGLITIERFDSQKYNWNNLQYWNEV